MLDLMKHKMYKIDKSHQCELSGAIMCTSFPLSLLEVMEVMHMGQDMGRQTGRYILIPWSSYYSTAQKISM